MKKYILFTLSSLLLLSCGMQTGEKPVTINEQYSVTIPQSMTESDEGSEDASMMYQNPWKELYIMVIDETKEEVDGAFEMGFLDSTSGMGLNGYTRFVQNNITEASIVKSKSEIRTKTINKMPAQLFNVHCNIDNLDIFYSAAVLEGKKHYYQVLTWTLEENMKDNEEQMIKMIQSFKEL